MNLMKSFYVTLWLAELAISNNNIGKIEAYYLIKDIFSRWPKWFQDSCIAELTKND